MSGLVWPRPKGEGVREGGRKGGREGGRACLFERNNKKQQGIVGHFLKAKVGTECSFVSGLCFSLDVCALQEPDGQLKAFTAGHGHRE